MVLGGTILALAAGAFLDSIIPARRAASINPVQALRTE
jgi:ABC-type lipoprotein release transport system permease subunit